MTEAVDSYLPKLREQIRGLQIQVRGVHDLMPYARNANIHPDWQVAQIAASIKEFGFLAPVVVHDDGTIAAGHGRVLAAMKLGLEEVPTINAKHLTPTQLRAFIIADNRIARNAQTDQEMMKVEMQELKVAGFDLAITGFSALELGDMFGGGSPGNSGGGGTGEGGGSAAPVGSLAERFLLPPFSVLDARQGYWQERKRAWLSLGIASELGRGGGHLEEVRDRRPV